MKPWEGLYLYGGLPQVHKPSLIMWKHQRDILQNTLPSTLKKCQGYKKLGKAENGYRQETKKTWWPNAEYAELECGTDKKH